MISLSLQIRDSASPALRAALDRLTHQRPLLTALGRGLEKDLRDHFTAKNAKPNKQGWPRQNFWARIRKATVFTGATDASATVAIADPAINAHYYGGPIRPVETKFLAIPARPEAYGVRPSSGLIPGLEFAVLPKGGPVLIQRELTQIRVVRDRRKGREGKQRVRSLGEQGGGVFYWLRRVVHIPRDPDALPATPVLQTKLSARAEAWLARVISRAKP